MKLKYKILFIEDTPKSISREVSKTREYLENDYGFECLQDDVSIMDYEGFEEEYLEIIDENTTSVRDTLKEFDLLMVDFDLGEEKTGDNLIKIIRDSNVYSEILFYSSNYEQLREKLNSNFIDGVFTSNRDELLDEIKKLIKVTIKKVQDVNNLRGLIMAEVAELDRIKKSILLKSKDNSDLKKYIKESVFNKISEELADLDCIIDPEKECQLIDVEKLLNNFLYDSFKKSRSVLKVKKLSDSCKDIPFVHDDYYKNVIKKRNVLAHEEEKIRETDGIKVLKYSDGNDLEFTEEHCIQIRKDIKKYKKLLKDIEQKLDE